MDSQKPLKNLKPKHEFLIGIDSDGCVFDTMEIKQKECFVPNIIKYFKLQPVAKYVREAVEFVNLYSKYRGTNRWPALMNSLSFARNRLEVVESGAVIPELLEVKKWMDSSKKLSNDSLAEYIKTMGLADSQELINALNWSEAVNQTIADIVYGIPPFTYAKKSIEKLSDFADMIVVSQTPTEALTREWQEHNIDGYVRLIAGQEMGSKAEHLSIAMSGRYSPDKTLMVGDALGDLAAAKSAGCLFYPIIPGKEGEAWKRFYVEIIDCFIAGNYKGNMEEEAIKYFEACLPDTPSWRVVK